MALARAAVVATIPQDPALETIPTSSR